MSVWETIKTWSVMETLISVMGLLLTLLLSTFGIMGPAEDDLRPSQHPPQADFLVLRPSKPVGPVVDSWKPRRRQQLRLMAHIEPGIDGLDGGHPLRLDRGGEGHNNPPRAHRLLFRGHQFTVDDDGDPVEGVVWRGVTGKAATASRIRFPPHVAVPCMVFFRNGRIPLYAARAGQLA